MKKAYSVYKSTVQNDATAVQLAAVLLLLRPVSLLSFCLDVWGAIRSVCGPDKQKQITSQSFWLSLDGRRFQTSW